MALIIVVLSLAAFSVYTFFTIKYREKEVKEVNLAGHYPTVSILDTIRNTDDSLGKNIESLFQVDYPNFEILFGVDSEDDPVIKTIKALQTQYAHVVSKIVITGHSSTENPKVSKLMVMEDFAEGQLFWVCDLNIRVEKDTLRKLVKEYNEKDSKIVFSPIRATGSHTLGSIVENAYFNHFLSGSVLTAWKLFKKQIIVGKSILVEKNTLGRFGGFSYFKNYLAEDYMMGATYTQCKIPISTNCTWVTSFNSCGSVKSFYNRMVRWSKLRYHLEFHFYILEILLNPIPLALIFSLLLRNQSGFALFAGSLFFKIMLEYLNFFFINRNDKKKMRIVLLFPLAILLKDTILFLVYFAPFFGSSVDWRGGKISIGKDTLISLSQESLLFYGA